MQKTLMHKTMRVDLGDYTLNVVQDGPDSGRPVVFGHALGTNVGIWDEVIARLPMGPRYLRYDLRGHGQSDPVAAPWSMGQLVREAEVLLDQLDVRDAVFVGISTTGMVAQGLAVKRLDQIRAIVLNCTAAKIGQPAHWQTRIDEMLANGAPAFTEMAHRTAEAWFPPALHGSETFARWQAALEATPHDSIIGGMQAISGTDFYTPTSGLRLSCLGIAGSHDIVTPPDLVRETVELIPGARFKLMKSSGHLPCVDAPEEYARHLGQFLRDIGHV